MVLPKELERQFEEGLAEFEKERNMPYVTNIERKAIEKGHREGLVEGMGREARESVIDILQARFGKPSARDVAQINRLEDLTVLQNLRREAVTVESLATFRKLLKAQSRPVNEE
jgi:hypothetical protein